MADKKLSKREQKAAAFRNRKKSAFTEEQAFPEVDFDAAAGEKNNDRSEQIDGIKKQPGPNKRKSAEPDQEQQQQQKKKRRRGGAAKKDNSKRFILFVGNLPKDTEANELAEYFEKSIQGDRPIVRLMTDRETKAPKGFAFVEFKDSQQLTSALGLHRSKFKSKPINVELTAGGGGTSDARKEKLKQKNERLQQERLAERQKNIEALKKTQEPTSSYALEE
ncbi:hypothetical protein BX666DRAFT_1878400 [Dichotomocladium elegans]|nr:hypothetical protein BX666DRAFT_1878400 [Dichotomocladium elegans]